MDAAWDGITRPEDLSPGGLALRDRLADRARSYDWPEVLAILAREPRARQLVAAGRVLAVRAAAPGAPRRRAGRGRRQADRDGGLASPPERRRRAPVRGRAAEGALP